MGTATQSDWQRDEHREESEATVETNWQPWDPRILLSGLIKHIVLLRTGLI